MKTLKQAADSVVNVDILEPATNRIIYAAVYETAYKAVDDAVYKAVRGAVYEDTYWDVSNAADDAALGAVRKRILGSQH